MPKVQELARELGLTSQEVLRHLDRIGRPAAGHTSEVDDDIARRLRIEFGNGRASWPGVDPDATMIARRPVGIPPPPPPGGAVPSTTAPSSDADAPTTTLEAFPRDKAAEHPSEPSDGDATRVLPWKKARREKRSWTHQLAELPILIFFAFLIAVLIKTFIAQAFFIPSESMLPTLRIGDRVLVEKLGYRVGDPERGHIIVFAKEVLGELPDVPWPEDARNFMRELLGLPTGQEEDYIKRIVAVGGDTIRYGGTPRHLEINGEVEEEPYIRGDRDRGSQTFNAADCKRFDMQVEAGGCVVPEGMVFVMGDNRSNSSDSRSFGPIHEEDIIGRAFVVIWPPRSFGGV
jgi:signal peptidase I